MVDKQLNESLQRLLADIHDPFLQTSWAEAKVLKSAELANGKLQLQLQFGYPVLESALVAAMDKLKTQASQFVGVTTVAVNHRVKIRAHAVQPGVNAHPAIRNVIAVGSGKGGVGKSTTAVNLACALADCGARVGILDADIYGPNIPLMLGAKTGPGVTEDKKWIPVEASGLQSHSIGYLVEEGVPTVWRGPMVSGALMQLLNDTCWDDLDYLFVDLPPGTGDIQLTMAKKLPVTAAVMVTTPQEVALQDVRKGIKMFDKVSIPIAGIVENMSFFQCGHCGEQTDVFSTGGGERLARELSLPFLGCLPLQPAIREGADGGEPIVRKRGNVAVIYQEMALKIAAWVSKRSRGYSQHFGSIDVQKDA